MRPLPPVAFPLIVTEQRTATRQALIDWRGNRYSGPPELAAARVAVHRRLGADTIDIATIDIATTVIARHRLAEPGLGVTIRDTGHVTALDTIALAWAPPGRPHRRKERIPPGTAALRAAAILTGTAGAVSTSSARLNAGLQRLGEDGALYHPESMPQLTRIRGPMRSKMTPGMSLSTTFIATERSKRPPHVGRSMSGTAPRSATAGPRSRSRCERSSNGCAVQRVRRRRRAARVPARSLGSCARRSRSREPAHRPGRNAAAGRLESRRRGRGLRIRP